MGPLLVLYHYLIPSNNKGLQKLPLIHCGYLAEEEFLFVYARQHGLLRECTGDYQGDIVPLELDTIFAAIYSDIARNFLSVPCYEKGYASLYFITVTR